MLMSLGMFTFEIDTAPFDQLRRRRNWRHPTNDRVGARPAGQFAGPGDDVVGLSGKVYANQIGNPQALSELAEMADTGQAFTLVDGEGDVYGAYVIEGLDETGRSFTADGKAQVIEFSIDLKRADDDEGETGAAGQAVRP
tara:strand:- start:3186 stop:3605 length:420 start_codon:yes stop_codon:yes gene_type:complete